MGSEPRNHLQQFRPLKLWMEAKSIHSLYDILVWDHHNWFAWRDLPLPNHLKNQWANLKRTLMGVAPINKSTQDNYVWDPSGGKFIVKYGYQLLQSSYNLDNWNLRSAIWKNECLPKIKKKIAWTLLKGKILIAEDLKKKRDSSPSMCSLCCSEEESSQHLFLDFPFAQHCWH